MKLTDALLWALALCLIGSVVAYGLTLAGTPT